MGVKWIEKRNAFSCSLPLTLYSFAFLNSFLGCHFFDTQSVKRLTLVNLLTVNYLTWCQVIDTMFNGVLRLVSLILSKHRFCLTLFLQDLLDLLKLVSFNKKRLDLLIDLNEFTNRNKMLWLIFHISVVKFKIIF